jgi:hypothetical protein
MSQNDNEGFSRYGELPPELRDWILKHSFDPHTFIVQGCSVVGMTKGCGSPSENFGSEGRQIKVFEVHEPPVRSAQFATDKEVRAYALKTHGVILQKAIPKHDVYYCHQGRIFKSDLSKGQMIFCNYERDTLGWCPYRMTRYDTLDKGSGEVGTEEFTAWVPDPPHIAFGHLKAFFKEYYLPSTSGRRNVLRRQ